MTHEKLDIKAELDWMRDALRRGVPPSIIAERFALNMVLGKLELCDRRADIGMSYQIIAKQLIAQGVSLGELGNSASLHRILGNQLIQTETDFVNNPHIRQKIVVSPAEGAFDAHNKDMRSYIYIYERDPRDPSIIRMHAIEHQGDFRELQRFFEGLGQKAEVIVGEDGKRFFQPLTITDGALISTDKIKEAALRSFETPERQAEMKEYLDRLNQALDTREQIQRWINEEIAKIVPDLTAKLINDPNRAIQEARAMAEQINREIAARRQDERREDLALGSARYGIESATRNHWAAASIFSTIASLSNAQATTSASSNSSPSSSAASQRGTFTSTLTSTARNVSTSGDGGLSTTLRGVFGAQTLQHYDRPLNLVERLQMEFAERLHGRAIREGVAERTRTLRSFLSSRMAAQSEAIERSLKTRERAVGNGASPLSGRGKLAGRETPLAARGRPIAGQNLKQGEKLVSIRAKANTTTESRISALRPRISKTAQSNSSLARATELPKVEPELRRTALQRILDRVKEIGRVLKERFTKAIIEPIRNTLRSVRQAALNAINRVRAVAAQVVLRVKKFAAQIVTRVTRIATYTRTLLKQIWRTLSATLRSSMRIRLFRIARLLARVQARKLHKLRIHLRARIAAYQQWVLIQLRLLQQLLFAQSITQGSKQRYYSTEESVQTVTHPSEKIQPSPGLLKRLTRFLKFLT